MKTTIDIDDRLLAAAKRHAAAHGTTLKAFVEEALRSRLVPATRRRERFRLDLPTVAGVAPPSVDVADRRALYDLLDDRT
jgi:hypothetical protein